MYPHRLFLLPVLLCESVDCNTHNQNTISSRIKVYYPFHPLQGCELDVINKPKKEDGAATVIAPDGARLKIPIWMVSSQAAQIELSEKAEISVRALVALVHLLEPFLKE